MNIEDYISEVLSLEEEIMVRYLFGDGLSEMTNEKRLAIIQQIVYVSDNPQEFIDQAVKHLKKVKNAGID